MTAATPTRTRRPQWVRVSGWLLGAYASLLAWFWGVVVVVAVAVLAVVARFHDIEISGLQFAHHGAVWFPFSLAIIFTSTYPAVHVAAGMTRRSFARASLVTALVVGAGNAAVATLLLLLERLVYDRLGWFHGLADETVSREVLSGSVAGYALGLALLFTAAMLTGTLVGLVYYRGGGWTGTLLLPLTMLPLVIAGLFPLRGGLSWSPWFVSQWWVSDWAPVVTLLALVGGAAAVVLLSRRMAIAPKEA